MWLAESAPALRSLINVNDPAFLPHGDHPARIRDYCERTGQPVPETPGEIVRVVLESLALTYRKTLEGIRLATYRAASRAEQGKSFARDTAVARRLASEYGMQIGSDGVHRAGSSQYQHDDQCQHGCYTQSRSNF